MTKSPAAFRATVSKACSVWGHRTVVKLISSTLQALPLTHVAVTLRPGELFMATGANRHGRVLIGDVTTMTIGFGANKAPQPKEQLNRTDAPNRTG